MRKATYVYFFKIDTTQEAIGNVTAADINEAREKIALIKQLLVDDIDRLFVIKQKKEKP